MTVLSTGVGERMQNFMGALGGFNKNALDLAIDSKRLLVLDTKDHEDAAYYGVAYINGNAIIKGPTNALLIKVDAKSEKGSAIKIPIDDSENISENDFIHFLSKKEKYNIKKDRAEVIVPALQIYNNLFKWCNIEQVLVPKIGLADGLIHHLYDIVIKDN
jgi:hypothetical protein